MGMKANTSGVTTSGVPKQGMKDTSEKAGKPAQNIHIGQSGQSSQREAGSVDPTYTGSFLIGGSGKAGN